MTPVVVLGLSVATLILLIVAYIATTRRERKASPSASPPQGPSSGEESGPPGGPIQPMGDIPDPRTIRVGDTIECPGVRARVRGVLHVSWRGKQWTEYILDDGTHRDVWLSVEELASAGEGQPAHLEVLLWTAVPTQGMVPAKSMLIMEGVEFHPTERGTAAFRSEGDTGRPERGLMDFADYRAEDGRLLSFGRVQGGAWTAAYASPLPPGSLSIERAPS